MPSMTIGKPHKNSENIMLRLDATNRLRLVSSLVTAAFRSRSCPSTTSSDASLRRLKSEKTLPMLAVWQAGAVRFANAVSLSSEPPRFMQRPLGTAKAKCVAVEFPGHVVNPPRALEMLGGEAKLREAFQEDSRFIELRYGGPDAPPYSVL